MQSLREGATRSPSSVMRVRSVTMFATWTHNLVFLYHAFHWIRCKSAWFFLFTSKVVHETRLREGAGGSDRQSRSGSNCLRGNLRLLRTHSCDDRNCYRSCPAGRPYRQPETGSWTKEGPRSMGRSCVDFIFKNRDKYDGEKMHKLQSHGNDNSSSQACLCLHRNLKDFRFHFFIAQGQDLLLWVSVCCFSMRQGESVHVGW